MDKIIEVQNLRKIYKQAKGKEPEALSGISFNVYKGEVFGILGLKREIGAVCNFISFPIFD